MFTSLYNSLKALFHKPNSASSPSIRQQTSSFQGLCFQSATSELLLKDSDRRKSMTHREQKPINNLNTPDPNTGITPLISSLLYRNSATTETFTRNNAVDINQASYKVKLNDPAGNTFDDEYPPLLVAIGCDFLQGIKLILQRPDTEINAKTRGCERFALFNALADEHFSAFHLLLDVKEEKKLELNNQSQGITTLYVAASRASTTLDNEKANEYFTALERLLTYSEVDIFCVVKFNQLTPLMIAHKNSDQRLKTIFSGYIKNNFSVYLNSYSQQIIEGLLNNTLNFYESNEFSDFYFLKEIKKVIPSLRFIHFTAVPNYYTKENSRKIIVIRFGENEYADTVYLDFYDLKLFTDHVFKNNSVPYLKIPISSDLNLSSTNFKGKCYPLTNDISQSIATFLCTIAEKIGSL